MGDKLKFPAPYFGGKSRIASLVWDRLGDCENYIEPFCGSAAVLLARPHPPRIETFNDLDGDAENSWRATHPEHGDPGAVADHVCEVLNDLDPYFVNVFRSLQGNPEETAEWADNPVNEAALHAIHRWLVLGEGAEDFRQRVRTEPDYYDAKRAGRWLFGACCWIGSGWAKEPDGELPNQTPKEASGWTGVCRRGKAGPAGGSGNRSVILGGGEGQAGHGIHPTGHPQNKRPRIDGKGHKGKNDGGAFAPGVLGTPPDGHRPQLADTYARGRGVHNDNHLSEKRPYIAGSGNALGVHCDSDGGPLGHGANSHVADFAGGTCAQRRAWLLDWFGRLRDRLRTVRVCCGHWLRVCDSESVTTRLGVTGVFLDPPYPLHAADGTASRSEGLYATDGSSASLDALRDEVLGWCKERGSNPKMRICVAGYDTDGYAVLEAMGWKCVAWKASGGYGNRSAKGKENAGRERLWFSKFCKHDKGLFDELPDDPEPELTEAVE